MSRLHAAAIRMVQHLTEERGAFPGVIVRLAQQPDKSWPHSLEFLKSGLLGVPAHNRALELARGPSVERTRSRM